MYSTWFPFLWCDTPELRHTIGREHTSRIHCTVIISREERKKKTFYVSVMNVRYTKPPKDVDTCVPASSQGWQILNEQFKSEYKENEAELNYAQQIKTTGFYLHGSVADSQSKTKARVSFYFILIKHQSPSRSNYTITSGSLLKSFVHSELLNKLLVSLTQTLYAWLICAQKCEERFFFFFLMKTLSVIIIQL